MFADKHFPEILYPEELDVYLSNGWYRMGQSIFTTHFLYFDQDVYSAIWVRLPITDFQFKKRARKLLRKNLERFRVVIRQGYISPEKERLFQKYKASFDGRLSPNLKDYLLDGEDYNIYNTYEVAVYDEDYLVAFSFFDIGAESVASITGVYDPEYEANSLGYFTMLAEIRFCQQKELAFYYPGYVVPGYQRFDYKLRIGEVEYYDVKKSKWLPYPNLEYYDIPVRKIKNQLQQVQNALDQHQIESNILINPFFEANLFCYWEARYFDYPILLALPTQTKGENLNIIYDIKEDLIKVFQCKSIDDLTNYFNKSFLETLDPNKHLLEIQLIEICLIKSKQLDQIVNLILDI